MINCPKCGADNMVGAIFCRTCHAKLNLDELSPEAFDEAPEPASKKAAQLIQRLVILVVCVVLGGICAGIFWPVNAGLDAAPNEAATARFRRMQGARGGGRFTFKSEEATGAIDSILGLPGAGTGTRKPQHVSVEFLSGDTVRLVLKSKLFGQIPMTTVLVGRPEVLGQGSVKFHVQEAKAGMLPMVGPLSASALRQFGALVDSSAELSAVADRIKAIEIKDGRARFTVGPATNTGMPGEMMPPS